MNNFVYIYTLSDPITKEIRYIGKTKNLKRREKEHLKEAKSNKLKNNHRKYWILGLLKNNLLPVFEALDEVKEEEWEFWEKYYISLFKTWGFNLVNKTNGGEGRTYPITEKHKMQISKALKGRISNRKGYKFTKEEKEKQKEITLRSYQIGKRKPVVHTMETKSKISRARKELFKNGSLNLKGERNGMYGKTVKIIVNGIIYNSQTECANELGIHHKTVHYRIKSKNFPNYQYLKAL